MGSSKVFKIFRIFLLSFLFELAVCCAAYSATYYVDYVGGDDSNNGISTSTPWKHCPGDMDATGNADIILSAGDTIVFKGGTTYSFDGTGNNYIAANASGTDTDRITYTSGHTASNPWGTGRAVIDCMNATPLAAKVNGCFFLGNFTDITVKDIEIKNFSENAGVSWNDSVGLIGWKDGNNSTDADLLIDNILGYNCNGLCVVIRGKYTAGGSAAKDITIQNSTLHNSAGHLIKLEYGLNNVLIYNNDLDNAGSDPYGSGNPMGNPICLATNDLFGGMSDITVRGNDMDDSLPTNNKGIMLLEGVQLLTNFTLEDNLIHVNVKTGTINFGVGVINAIIRNNVFTTHPTTHEGILRFYASIPGVDNSNGIEIYNNTFVAEPPAGIIMFKAGSVTDIQYKNVNIRNNIIDTGTKIDTNCIYIGNTKDGTDIPIVDMTTLTIDYNAYHNLNSTGNFFYVNNQAKTFTEFKTYLSGLLVAGADEHSTFGKVDFLNEGTGDFTLNWKDSVAKDQGEDLSNTGFSADKNGITRPQGPEWNIGAYEANTLNLLQILNITIL